MVSESIDRLLLIGLLLLSVVLACFVIIWAIIRLIRSMTNKGNRDSRIVWYLLLFVVSVWCLRYAVGYYSICFPLDGDSGLNKTEEIFNSLVHTFQTFSMDEEYTSYVSTGKAMMRYISNDNAFFTAAYGIYASVLNVLAPIYGGAILLNILQGVFPGVKLFFKRLAFWKKKYYFSELNDSSLACAKSILRQKHSFFCKPVIVFTDVYTDGEDEKSSELLKKAKALGGICTNDDLTHLNHRFTSKKEYWLIDENEIDNIKTLAELSNEKHYKSVEKTIIRIFYQNDSYALTEREIYEQFQAKYEKDVLKCSRALKRRIKKAAQRSTSDIDEDKEKTIIKELVKEKAPAIIRTRCYQNLIYNLLRDVPLYSPLIDRKDLRGLDVAILGNGNIGMEMLLSTYWCGQMLDIPLSVNVVSKDSEETACAKIDRINTDILLSTKRGEKLLSVYPDDGEPVYNEPYFSFRYCSSDINFESVESIKCTVPEKLGDTENVSEMLLVDADYYLVALGSDEANIHVAEKLCKSIASRQLDNGSPKNITIAYVVYNSDLCATLNKRLKPISEHINMVAIGGLDDVYSCENIFMLSSLERIEKAEALYNTLSRSDWVELSNKRADKPYEFWSSYACICHFGYKLFSGYVYSKKQNPSISWEDWQKKHTDYICETNCELAQLLGWLEHRRWNAYMRSIGFRFSREKNIFLKLHYCLAECQKNSDRDENKRDDYIDIAEKSKDPYIKLYDLTYIIPETELEKLKKLKQQTN